MFSVGVCLCPLAAWNATPTATLDVHFSQVTSGFWGKYVVMQNTVAGAGWINPQDGEHVYRIIRLPIASRVKGIAYAPGCALQTFDIAISDRRNYQFSFMCEAIPQTEIDGSVSPMTGLYDHAVKIEAKYVADWAPSFFGYDDGTTMEVPLGGAVSLDYQNHFRLPVPDLSKDKLAGSPPHRGEIRIWVRDQVTGRIVDQLRLSSQNSTLQATRFGGIPVESMHDASLLFTFCRSNPCVHDQFGFAIRARDYACRP